MFYLNNVDNDKNTAETKSYRKLTSMKTWENHYHTPHMENNTSYFRDIKIQMHYFSFASNAFVSA
jgi:hypothetical protein